MNIDENVKKIVMLLLKKWKLLFIFAIIGAVGAFVYTANFTTLTYNSSIEFLAYVEDSDQELNDNVGSASSSSSSKGTSNSEVRVSETSKMNYAMKMLDTYIEIFSTNAFNQKVADEINSRHGTSITAGQIRGSIHIKAIENTAMFIFDIVTTDPDLSYNIALALEDCVPDTMEKTNKGLVRASVEDNPLKASSAVSRGYPKKCVIGAIIGMVLAAAYVILRDLIDVRIKTEEELTERYQIPVLGSIPIFDTKSNSKAKENKKLSAKEVK